MPLTHYGLNGVCLPPKPWTGVTSDSRQVRPGYAFVAIQGTRTDGHRFIPDALHRGAGSVYSERPLPQPFPVPAFRVANARQTLALLTAQFYGNPAHKLRCIGATGTNGKTTTTTLLQWILNTPEKRAGLMGTVHNDTGQTVENARLTTPDAETLHAGLAEMVKNRLDYAILEVSSHGIKQERVHGIPFSLALFTNLSSDHSDFHPSVKDYIATKARLFARVPRNGAIVVNGDDPYVDQMTPCAVAPVFTFGMKGNTRANRDLVATFVGHRDNGTAVALGLSSRLRRAATRNETADNGVLPERLELLVPLYGHHNLANALGAITIALLEGRSPASIQSALLSFPGVWRRQQRLDIQGPLVIDDCCHNPGSYTALFEALKHQPANRIHFVNAIRGSRGVQINRAIASVLAQWGSAQHNLALWITDCADTASTYDMVTDEEREAFLQILDAQRISYVHSRDLLPVLRSVAQDLDIGDVAVLAGAHAMDTAAPLFRSVWSKQAVS